MRSRSIVFSVIGALAFAEVVSRVLYWRESAGHVFALPVLASVAFIDEARAEFDGPLVREDPVVGYSFVPGTHHIRIRKGALERDFVATIDRTGNRATSLPENDVSGRPEIWLLGCSFTWGYLVNDCDTFPWLLQEDLPQYAVRNFGANGFGTIHSYLRLKHAVESGQPLPVIAVVLYNNFHLARNTISPSALTSFRGQPDEFRWLRYPEVQLLPSGDLSVRLVNVFSEEAAKAPELTDAERVRLGEGILKACSDLCARANIKLVLGVQSGEMSDPVVRFAMQAGYTVIDDRVDFLQSGTRFTYQPLDGHPNERAHRRFAELLRAGLYPLLQSQPGERDELTFYWTPDRSQLAREVQFGNPGTGTVHLALGAQMDNKSIDATIYPSELTLPPRSRLAARLALTSNGPLPGTYTGYLDVRSGTLVQHRIPIRLEVPLVP